MEYEAKKFDYEIIEEKYLVRDILSSSLEEGLNLPKANNWAESFGRTGSNH